MGSDVERSHHAITVTLTGVDRVANWRRRIEIPFDKIAQARVDERAALESPIDHRIIGIGDHVGRRRPNLRRVGTMMGRGAIGRQFWAARATDEPQRLLVLELRDQAFQPPTPEARRHRRSVVNT